MSDPLISNMAEVLALYERAAAAGWVAQAHSRGDDLIVTLAPAAHHRQVVGLDAANAVLDIVESRKKGAP